MWTWPGFSFLILRHSFVETYTNDKSCHLRKWLNTHWQTCLESGWLKSTELRAEQLFALLPLVRHTQAPQEKHSSLKLTPELHWQGQGGYSLQWRWLSKCVYCFPYFLTVSLRSKWMLNTHVCVSAPMSAKCRPAPRTRWVVLACWRTLNRTIWIPKFFYKYEPY